MQRPKTSRIVETNRELPGDERRRKETSRIHFESSPLNRERKNALPLLGWNGFTRHSERVLQELSKATVARLG